MTPAPRWTINASKQNRHIPGCREYLPGRSILTHGDPQDLIDRFAGTGQLVGKVSRGVPGFRERVDFGEIIGEYVDLSGVSTPTTKGIIHYAKDGVHIVPARP